MMRAAILLGWISMIASGWACVADVSSSSDPDMDMDAVTCSWPSSFSPDTDWLSETAHNTANNGFPGNADPAFKLNGVAAAGRVSMQDLRTLLYPGATTKLYGHLMAWF